MNPCAKNKKPKGKEDDSYAGMEVARSVSKDRTDILSLVSLRQAQFNQRNLKLSGSLKNLQTFNAPASRFSFELFSRNYTDKIQRDACGCPPEQFTVKGLYAMVGY